MFQKDNATLLRHLSDNLTEIHSECLFLFFPLCSELLETSTSDLRGHSRCRKHKVTRFSIVRRSLEQVS